MTNRKNKKAVKLSQSQKIEIVDLYNSGLGGQVLGRRFDVSCSRIMLILNEFSIKRNSNKYSSKSSIDDKKEMLSLYEDGYSVDHIAKQFNLWHNSVNGILRVRGVSEFRKSKFYTKIDFDRSFITNITKELAYFYGFVLGDGSYGMSSGVPKIKIAIHKNDIETLYMFCDWLKFPREHIFLCKKVKTAELCIRDSILDTNKELWGVKQNKTYSPIIPSLKDKELLRYFIIGLIDADGHVKYEKSKYTIQLVGNKLIMEWVEEILRYIGYDGHVSPYYIEGKVWSRLRVSRKNDVIELAKILGVKDCSFLMKRKWANVINKIKELEIEGK